MDNTHLLDATEIFRKLNVHKKVWLPGTALLISHVLIRAAGIVHEARFPPRHVLLLPVQHDRGPHQRRGALEAGTHRFGFRLTA